MLGDIDVEGAIEGVLDRIAGEFSELSLQIGGLNLRAGLRLLRAGLHLARVRKVERLVKLCPSSPAARAPTVRARC